MCHLLTMTFYENTARTFHTHVMAEPSKGPKKANNRLNPTLNMT